jgi:hypothetical protein
MVQFIKGKDLTPEQIALLRKHRHESFTEGIAWSGERLPEAEIRQIILDHAWCFTDDGKRPSQYGSYGFRIHADAADGQNKRLRQLNALRKAKKKAGTKRPVGLLPSNRKRG